MVDTVRTITALQALLADNTSRDISPQDIRDMLVSLASRVEATAVKTTTYTVGVFDAYVPCNATGAAFTVNLPAAASVGAGKEVTIKKIDASANAVTVDGNASETIDGATTYSLSAQWKYVKLYSDGTNWHIVGNN